TQTVAVAGAKRVEQGRRAVELPAAPAGLRVEQLGACDAEKEDRRSPREVGDVLDELEERRLGPVDVVEHDDLGPLGGALLEETTERKLRLGGRAAEHRVRLDPDREQQLDERPVGDALAVVEAAAVEDVRLRTGVAAEVGHRPGTS